MWQNLMKLPYEKFILDEFLSEVKIEIVMLVIFSSLLSDHFQISFSEFRSVMFHYR